MTFIKAQFFNNDIYIQNYLKKMSTIMVHFESTGGFFPGLWNRCKIYLLFEWLYLMLQLRHQLNLNFLANV